MNTNLINLRKNKKLSQSDVAKILDLTPVQYGNYERGTRSIPQDKLLQLSKIFEVSIDYILGNTDIKNNDLKIKSVPVRPEYHKVPIVGSVACSWNAGFIDDFDGEYSFINDYLYNKYGDDIRAIYAHGNSMIDMISPGDLLFIIPAVDVQNNDIVIAEVGGDELTAKKFHYNEVGGFDLIPVNPVYGKQSYTDKEIETLPVNIVGRVIEIRKGLRP